MKRMLLLLCAIIGGPVMVYSGIRDYQNSKKLIAHGQHATAEVVDAIERVSRRSRTHYYYLVLKFQTEGGTAVTERKSVSKDVFDAGLKDQTAPVVYLPADPKIFQVGDHATTQVSGIILGSLFFLGGLAFLTYLWANRTRSTEPSVHTLPMALDQSQQDLKKAA